MRLVKLLLCLMMVCGVVVTLGCSDQATEITDIDDSMPYDEGHDEEMKEFDEEQAGDSDSLGGADDGEGGTFDDGEG